MLACPHLARVRVISAAESSEEMHLYPPYISKSCYIQSCCATSGEGLHEGLDWLSSNMPDDNK